MGELKFKVRGYNYFALYLVMAISSLIGSVSCTFFFLMGEWDSDAILIYIVVVVLCILLFFIGLLFNGMSKIYTNGASKEREELEKIRKETNRKRMQF